MIINTSDIETSKRVGTEVSHYPYLPSQTQVSIVPDTRALILERYHWVYPMDPDTSVAPMDFDLRSTLASGRN